MIITVWILSTILLIASGAYINEFDGPLNFLCPSRTQAINRVQSYHDNYKEDRRFALSCADVWTENPKDIPSCFWTGYQNGYDQLLHYFCPPNYYISGMNSVHHNHHEDRLWKLYCCNLHSLKLYGCSTSGWTNEFDQVQDFTVPSGQVMKAVIALHNNHHEDRRYEYEYCSIAPMDGGALVG